DLESVAKGIRLLFGRIPYFIEGSIRERQGELVTTIRVSMEDDPYTVRDEYDESVITVTGKPELVEPMIHETGLRILDRIDPLIVALYQHKLELENKEFDFPKTNQALKEYMSIPPAEQDYLGYDLLGRMHMERADMDSTLTETEREAERAKAIE